MHTGLVRVGFSVWECQERDETPWELMCTRPALGRSASPSPNWTKLAEAKVRARGAQEDAGIPSESLQPQESRPGWKGGGPASYPAEERKPPPPDRCPSPPSAHLTLVRGITKLILQMREPRPREIKSIAQGHIANERQKQGSMPE